MDCLRIVNYVCTIELGCRLNLHDICQRANNVEYNPKRFSALIMKKRNPSFTCLIFVTGKVVITGVKSARESTIASRKVCKVFQKLGYNVKVSGVKPQNIVGTFNVGKKIDLTKFQIANYHKSIYEPELFPGLTYRSRGCTFLLFMSGKVVITGAKSVDMLYESYDSNHMMIKYFTC